jgi:4'-phosphopantetheinyl transferase
MNCTVDVWTIDLDAPRTVLLSQDEQDRANRLRFAKDRGRWANARSSLRAVLATCLQVDPLEIGFDLGKHGKPLVKGVEFNLSHAGGWAMIAVSRCAPVGIDLEAIRDNVDIARLLDRIGETQVTGTSAELFQVWARREARTKAVGGPLMEIPTEDLRVVDLKAPEGFVAALAMLARDPEVTYCGGI